MRKFIIILTAIVFFASCTSNSQRNSNANGAVVSTPNHKIVIERLSGEFSHGLHEITIDDTTKVLLYRGVESCTMIQIK